MPSLLSIVRPSTRAAPSDVSRPVKPGSVSGEMPEMSLRMELRRSMAPSMTRLSGNTSSANSSGSTMLPSSFWSRRWKLTAPSWSVGFERSTKNRPAARAASIFAVLERSVVPS